MMMMMMPFEIYICVQLKNTHSQCTHYQNNYRKG